MGARLEQGSNSAKKRIERHTFSNESGEEYNASAFGGFSDYFRRKKIKLQNLDAELRSQSGHRPQIFKGLVCHVNGYTQPSLSDLHALIVQHGGGFMQYLDGKTTVTHIIASALTPKKKEEFRRYKVVKPAWIVDSVRAERLLPWDDYRVVDEGQGQKTLSFSSGQLRSQAIVKKQGYKEQSDGSWYTRDLKNRQAQKGSDVADDDDSMLDITSSMERALEAQPEPQLEKPLARRESKQMSNADATGAEDPNALLLADPRIRKSTVLNPEFLEQYYRESRLHHLSTWKAELKATLQELAAETSCQRPKKDLCQRRYIMHVDFDSFFAAISLKKHPELKNQPVVVAHGSGSGSEIASCNYPARAFGVKNGMWMRLAQELCPDLKVLPYDFPAYEAASKTFYDAILATGGIVQSVSIDEALVDISAICAECGNIVEEQTKADELAEHLRREISKRTGCAVSVGIGGNILQAKVALRKAKPAGQYQLRPGDVWDVIGNLEVQHLPGVARSIGGRLEDIGVKRVSDIRSLSKEKLINTLGRKTGERVWDYSQGVDRTEVGQETVRKSVSAEVNWGVRFESKEQVDEFLHGLSGELHKRLTKEGVSGQQLTLKVLKRAADAPLETTKHLGHGKCDACSKSVHLGVATNDSTTISQEAVALMKSLRIPPGDLRGIGLQMQKLKSAKANSSQKRLRFAMAGHASGNETGKEPVQPAQPSTQVLRPSQVSLSVLAEVPDEIRTKLTKQSFTLHALPEESNAQASNAKAGSKYVQNTVLDADGYGNLGDETLASLTNNSRASSSTSMLKHVTTPANKRIISVSSNVPTQFLMPSGADPDVLAELPDSIRAKLVRQVHDKPKAAVPAASTHPLVQSEASPSVVAANQGSCLNPPMGLPSQSQIDPTVLAELPEDVRAEIYEYYKLPSPQKGKEQSLLLQSPRKSKVVPESSRKSEPSPRKPKPSPSKRKRVIAPLRPRSRGEESNTLTQLNFLSRRPASALSESEAYEELDQEVLAALPEELRKEVIEQQQQLLQQQQRQLRCLKPKNRGEITQPKAATTIDLPSLRSPQVTFTSQKLHTLPSLREAVSLWVRGFVCGPYTEDVAALVTYLENVVLIERDLWKAVAVARWLKWVVGNVDRGDAEDDGECSWEDVVVQIKETIRRAAEERGLDVKI
ncbi:DNA repair protein [Piedraia hortae CBS 480.64]|uniref:DNA repair protein REV1 n=1 Tax=Piedraia hortae CBS 480.64 TaxID=1314780 RepID=A0A6A7C4W1_9PEZI|nr:DNA repair protein [Piedraia hortae CBS 480.64]